MDTNETLMSGELIHLGSFDVEEELETFTVCSVQPQTNNQAPTSRNYETETEVIPLLAKDIHQLTLPDKSFAETISAYGVTFASVLLYGRLTSTGASANGKLRYCLDDGTGLIQVRLLTSEALNDLCKLEMQCFRTFGSNKELYNSIQSIIKTTRSQLLEVGYLPYGTKALLIGRPIKFFEEVFFSAVEVILDYDVNRDFEIAVKNFIIDWYTKRFKGHQLNDPPTQDNTKQM